MPEVPETIITSSYAQLVQQIDDEFQHGIFEARKKLERQRLVTYWKVGELLDKYFNLYGLTSDEDRHVIFRRVGKDLHHEPNFVKKLFIFYRTYPQIPANQLINWSHYRTLITIPENYRRQAWEKRITAERLPSDTFYQLFQEERLSTQEGSVGDLESARMLSPKRGRLYHYCLIPESKVPWSKGFTVVDVGFRIRHEIPVVSNAKLETGKIFESRFSEAGYQLKRVAHSADVLYTYKAIVERVIDGDTLLVNIDCGFRTWTRQRLRLRGMNCPELLTIEGRQAKRFVQEQLDGCGFVVIKTIRTDSTDIYGRYVADVFFKKFEADAVVVVQEGQYLNQVLVDCGQADIC